MHWKEKLAAAIGIAGIGTAGCGIAIDENTILYANESARSHELRHTEQMRYVGGADVFWELWRSDPEFRCAVEMDAGSNPEEHFGCNGVDYDEWTKEIIAEIIADRRR